MNVLNATQRGDMICSDTQNVSEQIVLAIQSVIGNGPVALHEPQFSGNEWKYVKECLDTGWVSSVGKFVDRFERELASYTDAKYAITVVNGTAALHLALQLAGVQSNDEVLVPGLTFIATANAVSYCGAIPHLIDSEERTLGVDPEALRDYLKTIAEIQNNLCINRVTGRIIRAIIPMHTFGHPVDIEGIVSIAKDFHLVIIEDAAEALGSRIDDQHVGTFGIMGALSFNGNKTITTGGGGAILTNDALLAKHAKHLSTTAKLPHRWEYRHDEVGYNYRLPNINAALGCAQLEQISDLLRAKRQLFQAYQHAFQSIVDVSLVTEPIGCQSNYWLQTIILDHAVAEFRDEILLKTNEVGVMTRPAWSLMHQMPFYKACPQMPLPIAESLEKRLINIPSSSYDR